MAHLVTVSLGLLIYLSYSYCQAQGPTNASSRLATSAPTPNVTSISISSGITPSCNCSLNSTDPTTNGFNLLLALSVSGVSATLGVAAVLLCLIAVAIYNRRKGRTQGTHSVQKRATTLRKRSTKTSRNRSKTIINKTHDYETVIPNLLSKPKGKEQQAQVYEVPLSKSMSLTRQHTDKSLESNGIWSLEESSESQSRQTPSTRLPQEPIYMNLRTGESAQMCPSSPESSMQCSIVNAMHLGVYKNGNKAPGQEEDGGKNLLEASSQSWAI